MPNLSADIRNKDKLEELRWVERLSMTELLESMIDERYAAQVLSGTISAQHAEVTGTPAAGKEAK